MVNIQLVNLELGVTIGQHRLVSPLNLHAYVMVKQPAVYLPKKDCCLPKESKGSISLSRVSNKVPGVPARSGERKRFQVRKKWRSLPAEVGISPKLTYPPISVRVHLAMGQY